MAFRIWQVGLAIENDALRALAVQPRRHGWQLRHWWRQRIDGECGLPPAGLQDTLRAWRRQLPGSISLRVSLPFCLISQRRLVAPDKRLFEPERGWFIAAQARRLFPDAGDPPGLDYRPDDPRSNTLLVTAARQPALDRWLACLSGAGLEPRVVDIMPCALRYMAIEAGLPRDQPLIHATARGWLWVSAPARPLAFGFIPVGDAVDFAQAGRLMASAYPAGGPAYYSSDSRCAAPEGTLPWSPFSALWQAHPPIPAWPGAYVFAGGLAVRREDR